MDLQSTIKEQGESVTQIIHFIGGEKRTFHGIISNTINRVSLQNLKQKKEV